MAADSGDGLSASQIKQMLAEHQSRQDSDGACPESDLGEDPVAGSVVETGLNIPKRFSKEFSETGEPIKPTLPKFPDGLQTKDIDIPERMRNVLKDCGLWDMIPAEGFRGLVEQEQREDKEEEEDGIFTDEEYEILMDEGFEGSEEEEERREIIKFNAIKKLENALREVETDPGKIINMGLEAKRGLKVKTFHIVPFILSETWERWHKGGMDDEEFYFDEEDLNDCPDTTKVDRDPEVDECIKLLAQGKDLPDEVMFEKNVLPPEDGDSFMKRMHLIRDLYHDQFRKPKDRKVPPEKVKAVQERMEEFEREYAEKEDSVFEEDIQVSRAAPTWPEWQDRHFKLVQHMMYLLRAAHIEGTCTEPARRLKKYDLVADDVRFRFDNLGIDTRGFDVYREHMERLRSVGVTTQGAGIFQTMIPPDGERSEDNPCKWEMICDYYCNIPLPIWYLEKLDAEEKLEKERKQAEKKQEGEDEEVWKHPLDISDYVDSWKDETKLGLLQSMDATVRGAQDGKWEPTGLAIPVPESEGIDSDDPYPDEGPVWQQNEAQGDAWKNGKCFTINSTVKYVIDIKQGKISEIWIGWGAMIGPIKSMEEGEKLYRLAAGMDATVTTGDYRSFQQLVYDTCFKNPIDWIKETILDPMLSKRMAGTR